jgi:hypothetical protein
VLLTFRAPGHRPVTREVEPREDGTLEVTLERLPPDSSIAPPPDKVKDSRASKKRRSPDGGKKKPPPGDDTAAPPGDGTNTLEDPF